MSVKVNAWQSSVLTHRADAYTYRKKSDCTQSERSESHVEICSTLLRVLKTITVTGYNALIKTIVIDTYEYVMSRCLYGAVYRVTIIFNYDEFNKCRPDRETRISGIPTAGECFVQFDLNE